MQHIQTLVITPDLRVVRWEAKSIAKALVSNVDFGLQPPRINASPNGQY